MRTLRQIKKAIGGQAPQPKKKYYFGPVAHGTPYFLPKEKFLIRFIDLIWKDKFGTPRLEVEPRFMIIFWKWQFMIWWTTPYDDIPDYMYWEQLLWLTYYCDGDLDVARETWPWKDSETQASTWRPFEK